jgi:hypothetical protein
MLALVAHLYIYLHLHVHVHVQMQPLVHGSCLTLVAGALALTPHQPRSAKFFLSLSLFFYPSFAVAPPVPLLAWPLWVFGVLGAAFCFPPPRN